MPNLSSTEPHPRLGFEHVWVFFLQGVRKLVSEALNRYPGHSSVKLLLKRQPISVVVWAEEFLQLGSKDDTLFVKEGVHTSFENGLNCVLVCPDDMNKHLLYKYFGKVEGLVEMKLGYLLPPPGLLFEEEEDQFTVGLSREFFTLIGSGPGVELSIQS
ncbi:hypothetical protein VTK26DRAFT_1323 [Humicola hyalothermophila]